MSENTGPLLAIPRLQASLDQGPLSVDKRKQEKRCRTPALKATKRLRTSRHHEAALIDAQR
jgi:hypothetical protein